jgi:hypothetical protein
VAAYRFGHSIIRPFYVLNETRWPAAVVPIFGPDGEFNLNGGRPIPSTGHRVEEPPFPSTRASRPASPAQDRHEAVAAARPEPPGPSVSRALTRPVTCRPQHASAESSSACRRGQQVGEGLCASTALSNATLGSRTHTGWGGEAPLWYYILKEAELPPYNASGSGGGRQDRRRGPRRTPATGPELVPVPGRGVETRPNRWLGQTGQFTFVDLLEVRARCLGADDRLTPKDKEHQCDGFSR